MKLASLTFTFALAFALTPRAGAQTKTVVKQVGKPIVVVVKQDEKTAEAQQRERARRDSTIERHTNAEKTVAVSVCVDSSDVLVRGWDKNEVQARAQEAGTLRLLTPNVQPARRVEVLVDEEKDAELGPGDCGSAGQLELMVPRGASVSLELRDGHIEVSDVSEVKVESLSGDVNVRRVSKSVEVSSLSGDIELSDSSGAARLHAMSGSVEARNVRAVAAGDDFEAKSTSGDVTIEDVTHAQVNGSTVSGSVLYGGKLARGGVYEFKTISGDVVLELPADSSFSVHAKVVASGDIITDFPVKTSTGASSSATNAPPTPPDGTNGTNTMPPEPKGKHKPPKPPPTETRLDGTVGTGDAVVSLTSFSGSLQLRKQ